MVPEYLGDDLVQGINVVARSSDKTPSIYPKKVGEIGESRKGVAVSFLFVSVSMVSRMVHGLTNSTLTPSPRGVPCALGQAPNKLTRSSTTRNMPTLSLSIPGAPAPMAPPDLIQSVSPVNLPVFLLILPVNLLMFWV